MDPTPVNETPVTFLHSGRFASTRNVQMHTHPGTELILVTEGHCTIDVQHRSLDGWRGTLYVLPARVPHNQIEHEFTRTEYVTCRASPLLLDDSPRTLDVAADGWIPRWIGEICDLTADRRSDSGEEASALTHALLCRLRRVERAGRRTGMHPALRRALQLVDAAPAAPLDAARLSVHAGISASRLGALFRAGVGCGPMKYLQDVRMALARRLLTDPYRTVQEVARLCGFEDANYFSRLFRRRQGCSPSAYRQNRGLR
ncbi:MAG: helix-turn-helix domain-containing protein [Kiritimatiellae bacterium]|nr:helix-turn-helix domain-containing protein [Kiritimatiellia bacterium]